MVFAGLLDYVKRQKPLVVIAENVRGIMCRNKGCAPVVMDVASAFDAAGYHFGYRLLNTKAGKGAVAGHGVRGLWYTSEPTALLDGRFLQAALDSRAPS